MAVTVRNDVSWIVLVESVFVEDEDELLTANVNSTRKAGKARYRKSMLARRAEATSDRI